MQSKTQRVGEYLKELSEEKRNVIAAVRRVLRKNLPAGYKEVMQYGMISYVVPLSVYPAGYLGKATVPLPYIGLAAQKNHFALYFMSLYADKKLLHWFEKAYKNAGKKLDMGKSCVRFKKFEDLPAEVIAEAVRCVPPDTYVTLYEKAKRYSHAKNLV